MSERVEAVASPTLRTEMIVAFLVLAAITSGLIGWLTMVVRP